MTGKTLKAFSGMNEMFSVLFWGWLHRCRQLPNSSNSTQICAFSYLFKKLDINEKKNLKASYIKLLLNVSLSVIGSGVGRPWFDSRSTSPSRRALGEFIHLSYPQFSHL